MLNEMRKRDDTIVAGLHLIESMIQSQETIDHEHAMVIITGLLELFGVENTNPTQENEVAVEDLPPLRTY